MQHYQARRESDQPIEFNRSQRKSLAPFEPFVLVEGRTKYKCKVTAKQNQHAAATQPRTRRYDTRPANSCSFGTKFHIDDLLSLAQWPSSTTNSGKDESIGCGFHARPWYTGGSIAHHDWKPTTLRYVLGCFALMSVELPNPAMSSNEQHFKHLISGSNTNSCLDRPFWTSRRMGNSSRSTAAQESVHTPNNSLLQYDAP